jgi:prophage regulatory protein
MNLGYSIFRLPEVKSFTGLSRSSIYMKIAQNSFPKPIRLGSRAVGWLSNEIETWVSERIEQSRRGEV